MTGHAEQDLEGPQALIGVLQEGRVQKGRRHELSSILRAHLKGTRHHVKAVSLQGVPYPFIEFLKALQRGGLCLDNRVNRVQMLERPIGLEETLDHGDDKKPGLEEL